MRDRPDRTIVRPRRPDDPPPGTRWQYGQGRRRQPGDALSEQQAAALAVVIEYFEQHGHAPSLRNICDAMNVRSVHTVSEHVSGLVEKGYLARTTSASRAIAVVHPRYARCSICGERMDVVVAFGVARIICQHCWIELEHRCAHCFRYRRDEPDPWGHCRHPDMAAKDDGFVWDENQRCPLTPSGFWPRENPKDAANA